MNLILYTGPNCCLCDNAYSVIEELNETLIKSKTDNNKYLEVEKVNIRNSSKLYHLYAARIPVLKICGTEKELGWPFDLQQLRNFVA